MMTIFMFALALPYNHWTHPDHRIGFVVLYSLTFFFANFGPNATNSRALPQGAPARDCGALSRLSPHSEKSLLLEDSAHNKYQDDNRSSINRVAQLVERAQLAQCRHLNHYTSHCYCWRVRGASPMADCRLRSVLSGLGTTTSESGNRLTVTFCRDAGVLTWYQQAITDF